MVVFLGVVFAIIWMVSQALIPAVVGQTIDVAITDNARSGVVLWSLIVLGLGAARAVMAVVFYRNSIISHTNAGFITVQAVTRQAARMGATLPKRIARGDVIAIGTVDIAEIGAGIGTVGRLLGSIAAIVVVAFVMLWTSVPLGLLVLIGVPVMIGLTTLLLRPLLRRQQQYRSLQGELTGQAVDITAGLRVLRGIGGESMFARNFRSGSGRLRDADVAVSKSEANLSALRVLIPGFLLCSVTFVAAHFALAGSLTVGQLIAFYGYATFLTLPVNTILDAIGSLMRALVASRRVVNILNMDPELQDPAADSSQPTPPHGGQPALTDNASGLNLARGSFHAIVCADPSEAEPLARRLTRFEDTGSPALDGRPLDTFPLRELRARLLLSLNRDRLFRGRLRDELASHCPASDEEVWEAVRLAEATDVIKTLPDGLGTEISEEARSFSGGQAQRLRLARALLKRADVIVLVEPTNAVDSHTEAAIARNLARWEDDGALNHRGNGAARGRTIVLFTSSPLLLNEADQVTYVEAGAVVRSGTHRELLDEVHGYRATILQSEETEGAV